MTLNVLSLFAGIGGLELGLERAGMTTVGQVEIDPFCQRVLAKHWPEVPRHDDVRTAVDWWRSEPRPEVDLVCGGFPCQPVSVAGRQLAQADDRWLWPAMADVIRGLRPRYALMENVPGLLARGMGDVLGDLAACGYDAEWDCVPAVAVGAPHRRDRVWIVATDTRSQRGRVQPVAESRGGSATVAIDDGAQGHVADPGSERFDRRAGEQGGRRDEAVGEQAVDHAGNGSGALADTESNGRREGRPGRPAGHSADRQGIAQAELADTHGVGWGRQAEHRTRRWPQPQPGGWWATEPDVGRVAHGVPDRVDRLRALGNAVVPQVAEYIGRLIVAADEGVVA